MADPRPQSRRRRTARARRGADALRRRPARPPFCGQPRPGSSRRADCLLTFSHVVGAELRQPGRADGRPLGRRRGDVVRAARRVRLARAGSALAMGGLARIADDDIKLMLGRILIDLSIGGTEPMTGWYVASTTTRDGGDIVVGPVARDPAVPGVDRAVRREQPASASSDGRLLWAVMGTRGRDLGWHAGVSVSDPAGEHIEPPTIIAEADGRDYSDIDVIRLDDGRFLAVVREHQTRQSVWSHSRRRGAHLVADPSRRRSSARTSSCSGFAPGAIACAYRDEDPALRGVSLSVSEDGGETWTFAGQLYAADPDALHRARAASAATRTWSQLGVGRSRVSSCTRYPTAIDGTQLHWLRLRDRT